MMEAINDEHILNTPSKISLCLLMSIRVAHIVYLAICHEMTVCYGFGAINVNNLWWLSLDNYLFCKLWICEFSVYVVWMFTGYN